MSNVTRDYETVDDVDQGKLVHVPQLRVVFFEKVQSDVEEGEPGGEVGEQHHGTRDVALGLFTNFDLQNLAILLTSERLDCQKIYPKAAFIKNF